MPRLKRNARHDGILITSVGMLSWPNPLSPHSSLLSTPPCLPIPPIPSLPPSLPPLVPKHTRPIPLSTSLRDAKERKEAYDCWVKKHFSNFERNCCWGWAPQEHRVDSATEVRVVAGSELGGKEGDVEEVGGGVRKDVGDGGGAYQQVGQVEEAGGGCMGPSSVVEPVKNSVDPPTTASDRVTGQSVSSVDGGVFRGVTDSSKGTFTISASGVGETPRFNSTPRLGETPRIEEERPTPRGVVGGTTTTPRRTTGETPRISEGRSKTPSVVSHTPSKPSVPEVELDENQIASRVLLDNVMAKQFEKVVPETPRDVAPPSSPQQPPQAPIGTPRDQQQGASRRGSASGSLTGGNESDFLAGAATDGSAAQSGVEQVPQVPARSSSKRRLNLKGMASSVKKKLPRIGFKRGRSKTAKRSKEDAGADADVDDDGGEPEQTYETLGDSTAGKEDTTEVLDHTGAMLTPREVDHEAGAATSPVLVQQEDGVVEGPGEEQVTGPEKDGMEEVSPGGRASRSPSARRDPASPTLSAKEKLGLSPKRVPSSPGRGEELPAIDGPAEEKLPEEETLPEPWTSNLFQFGPTFCFLWPFIYVWWSMWRKWYQYRQNMYKEQVDTLLSVENVSATGRAFITFNMMGPRRDFLAKYHKSREEDEFDVIRDFGRISEVGTVLKTCLKKWFCCCCEPAAANGSSPPSSSGRLVLDPTTPDVLSTAAHHDARGGPRSSLLSEEEDYSPVDHLERPNTSPFLQRESQHNSLDNYTSSPSLPPNASPGLSSPPELHLCPSASSSAVPYPGTLLLPLREPGAPGPLQQQPSMPGSRKSLRSEGGTSIGGDISPYSSMRNNVYGSPVHARMTDFGDYSPLSCGTGGRRRRDFKVDCYNPAGDPNGSGSFQFFLPREGSAAGRESLSSGGGSISPSCRTAQRYSVGSSVGRCSSTDTVGSQTPFFPLLAEGSHRAEAPAEPSAVGAGHAPGLLHEQSAAPGDFFDNAYRQQSSATTPPVPSLATNGTPLEDRMRGASSSATSAGEQEQEDTTGEQLHPPAGDVEVGCCSWMFSLVQLAVTWVWGHVNVNLFRSREAERHAQQIKYHKSQLGLGTPESAQEELTDEEIRKDLAAWAAPTSADLQWQNLDTSLLEAQVTGMVWMVVVVAFLVGSTISLRRGLKR